MTQDRPRRAAAAAFVLLSLLFAVGEGVALATHSSSTIGLFAIDANAEGNAATSLGPIDGCSRVETGSELKVDYVVDSIPQDRPMIGFEAQVRYDPQLLAVVAVDYDLLLAAVGTYSPFSGLSDELPDSDGNLRLSVLDAASTSDPEANVERGAGVLARITLQAKAAGVSEVAIALQEDPQIYPLVQDTKNETIFADKLGSASLAVGEDCPAEATEPNIIDLAEINETIRIQQQAQDSPTPIGGGTTASPPDGPTPQGQTAAPSPMMVPCAVTPIPSPSPTPDASLTPPPSSPAADAQAPESPASTSTQIPVISPTPTDVLCTPTPTPVQDEIVDVEEDSDTVLIGGAALLLALGTATAGGGWYLYRRSRNSSPGE